MTGPAVVRTRRGHIYAGTAALDRAGVLSMPDAKLLHRDVAGERTYLPCPRAWASHEWCEVEWLDAERDEAVAA